jgi:ribonuclease Z
MTFELTILGSNSATPAYGRNQTSQVLNINEKLYLIDCGEGTQLQLLKYNIKSSRIKYIFISHLHGDHYLGLVGLISSMHLIGRKEELILFGPPELKQIIDIHLLYSDTQLRYPLVFRPTQSSTEQVLLENEDVIVRSFPLDHRIPCTGFRFDERPRLAKINIEAVKSQRVPRECLPLLKRGKDCISIDGKVYKPAEFTYPPPLTRSYAFCSDTLDSGSYHTSIADVSLLYHEATFLNDMESRAIDTYHTTALQAGIIAKNVRAKKLLIGHFSARYRSLDSLLNESRSAFRNSFLAVEGSTFPIEL